MGMYVAGIDIGATNLKFGIFNERGIRLYMRVVRSVQGQPETTAEQIADLIKRGYRRIIVGLGGSGTNDGGTGALSRMGAKFFDKNRHFHENAPAPFLTNGQKFVNLVI